MIFLKFSKFSPKTFPIAPHFYPIWRSKEVLLLGSAQCSKKIGDGPMNMAPSKKRKESVRAPMKCQSPEF